MLVRGRVSASRMTVGWGSRGCDTLDTRRKLWRKMKGAVIERERERVNEKEIEWLFSFCFIH